MSFRYCKYHKKAVNACIQSRASLMLDENDPFRIEHIVRKVKRDTFFKEAEDRLWNLQLGYNTARKAMRSQNLSLENSKIAIKDIIKRIKPRKPRERM